MLGSKTMTFGPRFSGPAGGGAAADTPIPKRKTVRATVTPANRRSGDMTPPTPSIVVVLRAAGARHQLAQAHRILGDPARGAYGWMTARRFHRGAGIEPAQGFRVWLWALEKARPSQTSYSVDADRRGLPADRASRGSCRCSGGWSRRRASGL